MKALDRLYADCVKEETNIIYLFDHNFMILCPKFFAAPFLPPQPKCLGVDRSLTKFVDRSAIDEVWYQAFILLREIGRSHIGRGLKQFLVGPSDPNFCWELDAKDSLVFPPYYVLSKPSSLFPLVFLFGGKLVKRNLLQLLNPFFILLLGILGNCRRFPIPAPRRPKPETELREFDDSTDYLRRIFLRESVANKSITKANALTDDGAKIILSPIAETIGLSSILKSIH